MSNSMSTSMASPNSPCFTFIKSELLIDCIKSNTVDDFESCIHQFDLFFTKLKGAVHVRCLNMSMDNCRNALSDQISNGDSCRLQQTMQNCEEPNTKG